ncbi:MAG TPA: B12 lower ligand biosynthesis radical SAM protein BzaD [Desulfosporosinus sp.]
MRVLMIQTPSAEGMYQERVYPIGIVLLASCLQGHGHEVTILDMNLELDSFGALKEKLLTFQPEAVGLSLSNIDPMGTDTSSFISSFIVTVHLIAAVLPQAWLIAGGTGFSLFPLRLMQEIPDLDYGIIGEAEVSFPALLRTIDNPAHLPGLCWRVGMRVKVTPPATTFDMVKYVQVDRRLLDLELYKRINHSVPTIGIEAKRGCALCCAYCVYPQLQGARWRCRPTKDVVDEIEILHKDYGIERFHFTDPVLNVPHGHLEGICEEILRRKLKVRWDGFMREDHINEHNAALFERAGCECFSFSPDGLCQDSLDVLCKNLSETEILKAASIVAQTEVPSVYHFMVNVPGETKETSKQGMRFIEQLYELHSQKKNLGTIVLNNIRILPGTRIERMARAQRIINAETDLLCPTYYNPRPFNTLKYKLETLQQCKNVFMRQEVK